MATLPPSSPTPTLPPCTRGLTAADLSAYRDGAPIGDTAAALDAHIAGCPACRARLAQFDHLADALRAERAPEPDERLWQVVRRAAETGARHRFGRRPLLLPGWRDRASTGHPYTTVVRPLWGGVGAAAAVLLLVLGFAQLFALHGASTRVTHTPTATPFPTITPLPTPTPALLPAHPLAWHAETLPANPTEFDEGAITPAGDGQTAYACGVTSSPQLLIWMTHDQGRDWTPAQVIPPAPNVNGCELVVDTSDASVAALCWVGRGGGAGDSCTMWMTTVDSGVTWQQVPYQPFVAYDQLDSRGGAIYAVRETESANGSVAYHLSESRDRMRTWKNIDAGLADAVAGFWLQPDTQAILAVQSGDAPNAPSYLWFSPDDGTTWRPLTVPVPLRPYAPARLSNGPSSNTIVVLARAGHPTQICTEGSTPQLANAVTCSSDGGQTWQSRPALSGTPPYQYGGPGAIAIANDGSVLAATPAGTASGYGLYRLKPGATSWQLLGNLPQLNVVYCPGSGAGTLWATPALGTNLDPQQRMFTAAYTP